MNKTIQYTKTINGFIGEQNPGFIQWISSYKGFK